MTGQDIIPYIPDSAHKKDMLAGRFDDFIASYCAIFGASDSEIVAEELDHLLDVLDDAGYLYDGYTPVRALESYKYLRKIGLPEDIIEDVEEVVAVELKGRDGETLVVLPRLDDEVDVLDDEYVEQMKDAYEAAGYQATDYKTALKKEAAKIAASLPKKSFHSYERMKDMLLAKYQDVISYDTIIATIVDAIDV